MKPSRTIKKKMWGILTRVSNVYEVFDTKKEAAFFTNPTLGERVIPVVVVYKIPKNKQP